MCPSGKWVGGNREGLLGRGNSMGKGLQAWESRMSSGNHEMCEAIIEAHRGAGAGWMSTPAGEGVFQEESEGQKRLKTE